MDEKKIEAIENVWSIHLHSDGHLDNWIKDYFGGLSIHHLEKGTSVLIGEMPDMPAVYGFILKLRDAGLSINSLRIEKIKRNFIEGEKKNG